MTTTSRSSRERAPGAHSATTPFSANQNAAAAAFGDQRGGRPVATRPAPAPGGGLRAAAYRPGPAAIPGAASRPGASGASAAPLAPLSSADRAKIVVGLLSVIVVILLAAAYVRSSTSAFKQSCARAELGVAQLSFTDSTLCDVKRMIP
jgi:hypothetical protein